MDNSQAHDYSSASAYNEYITALIREMERILSEASLWPSNSVDKIVDSNWSCAGTEIVESALLHIRKYPCRLHHNTRIRVQPSTDWLIQNLDHEQIVNEICCWVWKLFLKDFWRLYSIYDYFKSSISKRGVIYKIKHAQDKKSRYLFANANGATKRFSTSKWNQHFCLGVRLSRSCAERIHCGKLSVNLRRISKTFSTWSNPNHGRRIRR